MSHDDYGQYITDLDGDSYSSVCLGCNPGYAAEPSPCSAHVPRAVQVSFLDGKQVIAGELEQHRWLMLLTVAADRYNQKLYYFTNEEAAVKQFLQLYRGCGESVSCTLSACVFRP